MLPLRSAARGLRRPRDTEATARLVRTFLVAPRQAGATVSRVRQRDALRIAPNPLQHSGNRWRCVFHPRSGACLPVHSHAQGREGEDRKDADCEPGPDDGQKGAAGRMRDRLEGAAREGVEGTREAVAGARERAVEARDRAVEAKDRAVERAQEGGRTVKMLWRRYGLVAVGTYLGMYMVTLGGIFLIYDHGLLAADVPPGGAEVVEHLRAMLSFLPEWAQRGLDRLHDRFMEDPRARHFALAWITTKLTEPVRLVMAFYLTPRVARALGRAPPKDEAAAKKVAKTTTAAATAPPDTGAAAGRERGGASGGPTTAGASALAEKAAAGSGGGDWASSGGASHKTPDSRV